MKNNNMAEAFILLPYCNFSGVYALIIIIFRTLILYFTVIASLRIMGKRQIGELQPSELVVAIMISDLASVPMQAIDLPLISGILPVLTLIVAEVFMSYASLKFKWIRRLLSGDPSIIIYKGVINEKELGRLRFNISDLMEELRICGCYNVADVEMAVLETNGKLSVLKKDEDTEKKGIPFIIISDGSFNAGELRRGKISEKQAIEKIRKLGIQSEKNIFIASMDATGELFVQLKKKNKGGRKK